MRIYTFHSLYRFNEAVAAHAWDVEAHGHTLLALRDGEVVARFN